MSLKFPGGSIPDDVLSNVLDYWSISDLADALGVKNIKAAGSNKFIASCPAPDHADETPSFSLYDNNNYCKCHGCSFGGGAVHLFGAVKGLDPRADFREIVEGIAKLNGTFSTLEAAAQKNPIQSGKLTLEQKIINANTKLAKAFEAELKKNPEAQAYLTDERGLSQETINKFKLGYVGNNLVAMCKELGIPDDIAVQASILKRDDNGNLRSFFFNRVMFPIENEHGKIVGFGGRVMGDQKPKYLNTAETPVFKKGSLLYNYKQAYKGQSRLTGKALVTEGYMDVVALSNVGIDHATGALGTSFSTENSELLMKRFADITFCFDGDAAGQKAADRALKNVLPLMNGDSEVKFLMMPEGMDPDDYIAKKGVESFDNFVGGAWPLDEYFIETLSNKYPDSIVGKSKMAKEAGELIATMPNSIYRDLLVNAVSDELRLDSDRLKEHLEIMGAQRGPGGYQKASGAAQQIQEMPEAATSAGPQVAQLKQQHFTGAKVSVPAKKPMTRERAFKINHNAAIKAWSASEFSLEKQDITTFVHGVVARDVEVSMGNTNPQELSKILSEFVNHKTGSPLNEAQISYVEEIIIRANRISLDANEHTHSMSLDGAMQVVAGHKKSAAGPSR